MESNELSCRRPLLVMHLRAPSNFRQEDASIGKTDCSSPSPQVAEKQRRSNVILVLVTALKWGFCGNLTGRPGNDYGA